jgi:hypothetical protein
VEGGWRDNVEQEGFAFDTDAESGTESMDYAAKENEDE